jgi:UDP-2,4-diacetamido-2,4,6-trideoxy-beta-L-altropyranose hydrolase
MYRSSILIRADASLVIGTGHVMRCLALAQGWQDAGGRAVFAMAETTPLLEKRLLCEDVDTVSLSCLPGTTEDVSATVEAAAHYHARWIVVDGYRFGTDYQRWLKSSGLKVLFIDDNAPCNSYSADLVLNQNSHATEFAYANRAPTTKLLLGPRYALLRREFESLRSRERKIPSVARNLLITMGGSDPTNVTLRVMLALPQIQVEGMRVKVAVGGSNPHRSSLEEYVGEQNGCVELLSDVQDMAELVAWADVGVAAAGAVSWEICALGLPSLLIPVAENQWRAASDLDRRGAARIVDERFSAPQLAEQLRDLMLARESRQEMSKMARSLLDAGGARRVVDAILSSSD